MSWQRHSPEGNITEDATTLPLFIDNQRYRLGDVFNTLMDHYPGHALDIATTSLSLDGWGVLAERIQTMGSLRLLLGCHPEGEAVCEEGGGGRPETRPHLTDLEEKEHLTEDFIAFLRQEQVKVRLHTQPPLPANCALFYQGSGFEHFHPVAALSGSSTITYAGLIAHTEINMLYRADLVVGDALLASMRGQLEPEKRKRLTLLEKGDRSLAASLPGIVVIHSLVEWYDQQWEVAQDGKEGLLDWLEAAKFMP